MVASGSGPYGSGSLGEKAIFLRSAFGARLRRRPSARPSAAMSYRLCNSRRTASDTHVGYSFITPLRCATSRTPPGTAPERVGWSPHPRARASRGQRNAVAASHSSCLPILALWLLLLLRPVKATRCAGARRRWSPSRTWGLVIRCSRQLLRKMSQRSKRTRRLVAPSPSCPDASPSHGPSLRTARANDAPSGGPVVIARQGRPALLEPFHNTGLRPGRAGLEPVLFRRSLRWPWDAGQQAGTSCFKRSRSRVDQAW